MLVILVSIGEYIVSQSVYFVCLLKLFLLIYYLLKNILGKIIIIFNFNVYLL